MTARTITKYFERRLAEQGYDADNIYWSLGYCQGDGMDFEGRARAHDLYSRLLGVPPEEISAALRDSRVTVTRSGFYHHYNSMSVEVEWDDEGASPEVKEAMSQFTTSVELDVIETSRALEKEGYAILEACNPTWFRLSDLWTDATYDSARSVSARTFKRGDFAVEVSMYENDHLDGYESGDEEADHADMIRMVNGEIVSYDVCVRVSVDGFTVFQEWAHGVTDERTKIHPLQVARELLSGARPALRSYAKKLDRLAGREPRKH